MRQFIHSLAVRISFGIFIILSLALVSVGYYVFTFRFRIERQRIEKAAALPAMLMSKDALAFAKVRDRAALETIIGEPVIEAMVVLRDMRIAYATRQTLEGRVFDSTVAGVAIRFNQTSARPHVFWVRERDHATLSVIAPCTPGGGIAGWTYVKLNVRQLTPDNRAVVFVYIFGSLLFTTVVTILLALLLRRMIVPRVSAVNRCLLRVEQGDLSARIETGHTEDELARLQRGVNEIIATIERQVRDQRKQQKELELSESRFRKLADMLPIGVFECNERGVFVFANRTALDLFGYTMDEISGRLTPLDLINPADRPRAAANIAALLAGTISSGNEYAALRKDGSTFPAMVYSSGITTDGAATGIRGAIIDLTEQRKREEETTALMEMLRQSEKMQAIGELAGGIAHDFNNQLTGIIGGAEIIKATLPAGHELTEDAAMIITGARRAAELTSQLLAYARKGKYLSQPVDLHETVVEVVRLLGRSIDKRITIVTDLACPRAVVTGDSTQLQNALLNLAINARDAMPGGGTLTIATALRVLDSSYCDSSSYALVAGDYVCVSVTDTGSGMSDEIKKHLFEPFFTTKPRGQGTGMGLAAVFGTVTGHRGAIEVESESGTGSRFTILLPAGAELEALPAVSPEKTDTLPEGLTVMVVDDEDVVRRVAGTVLQRAGCTVIACSGGAEAIERYRTSQKRIDLVIADMVMPEMNGRDLFQAIRAVDPRAAILITSGYTSGSDVEELLREGARGLLQKPYLAHELISAVLRAIS